MWDEKERADPDAKMLGNTESPAEKNGKEAHCIPLTSFRASESKMEPRSMVLVDVDELIHRKCNAADRGEGFLGGLGGEFGIRSAH